MCSFEESNNNFIAQCVHGLIFFIQGGLKHHEEEVISYFSDDPSAIMISTVPSRYTINIQILLLVFVPLSSIEKNLQSMQCHFNMHTIKWCDFKALFPKQNIKLVSQKFHHAKVLPHYSHSFLLVICGRSFIMKTWNKLLLQ